ncbi:hypothetical protein S7711_09682 [Stachybotrys chartarum IBT 7711]|uniref:AttH domain-containing protein n=1 Tax=Stachybotrys chartarum (strain CBS 109288 / IBT 7711) TaxID=1280523 RepID=A0A084AXD3_STACB|nr:hypothetical protein S7711_09682 [Stachybotrys chartarum IBT 7711]
MLLAQISTLSLSLLLGRGVVAYQRNSSTCVNHPALDGDIVNGHVEMIDDPLRNFDSIMIPVYNASAIEDWSHDAVSADGMTGLAFTSSRGSIGGVPGAQRLFISAVWPNGTRYMEMAFTDESSIDSCPEQTIGRWYNTTTDVEWKFEYSADYQDTLVTINSPTVSGTIKMQSLAPPLYPNGLEYPNPDGNTLFAPLLYWVENVPVGAVQANLSILGTSFILDGFGGRERNWLSLSWGDSSTSWDMMRGVVGPYRYIGWAHQSKIEGFQYSMVLLKEETVIFRTQRLQPFDKEPWGTITQTNDSSIHLTSPPDANVRLPESTFTGYTIEMVSPETEEHWKFDIGFTQTVYWFQAGRSTLIGGYTANVTGGLVGGCQYSGLSSGNLQETRSEGLM